VKRLQPPCAAAVQLPGVDCFRTATVAVCALTTAWNAGRTDVPGESPTVVVVPCCTRHRDPVAEVLDAETVEPVLCMTLADLPYFLADLEDGMGCEFDVPQLVSRRPH
jgi:hypothetical protein